MQAAIWGMDHFAANLRGRKFTLITDYRPLDIHGSGTRLDFGTGQIAIFIGELYFMLPFTVQVKHFPGMEMH